MFKIGEFSKIAQVSGHLLRYYDEIGLLKPAQIDQWTGYRYYSSQQFPILNRILAPKDLGLSLDQIRRMLAEDVSAEEIRGMFALRKAQIEQNLQADLARLKHIESRLRRIEQGEMNDDYEIVIKSIPTQRMLAFRSQFPSFASVGKLISEMQTSLPKRINRKSIGHLTALLHNTMYGDNVVDLEMGFMLNQSFNGDVALSNGIKMRMQELPAVKTMATAIWVGSPFESFNCRGAIATWIETNGYEINGLGREVFIVPPLPGREHETILEIQYPLAPARHISV